MEDHNIDETKKEELIQNLFELVFEKAKNDSKETKPYGISRYLQNVFKEKIKERTLTRYYDGYILKKEDEKRTPNKYSLDILSNYLGYGDFNKFDLNSECEIEKKKIRKEKSKIEKELSAVKRIGFIIIIILLSISTLFILKYYKKNCMIWVKDHYEKIRCSGLESEKKLDETVLKNFIKAEVCKDSIFFRNGEAVIHYTRYNNVVDFFKQAGEHPIYKGVYTDPITLRIIDSRVKPCESNK